MKPFLLNTSKLGFALALVIGLTQPARCDQEIGINGEIQVLGGTKPVLVSLSGFTGEALEVLSFDLNVQGFKVVPPEAAQFEISGSANGNLTGNVIDHASHATIFSRSYSGASLRRQAHAFANDIVTTNLGIPGIGLTKIAYKKEIARGHGEIYVSDFDGHDAQQITRDNTIVAAPAWVPGRLALYYTSYFPGNPDIFYTSLTTGQRSILAKFSGLNTSAAVSPDGNRVAMVLSRSGNPNIWVMNADGSNLQKLTSSSEDSSPCWSADGKWICYATKLHARRVLAKVPATGGEVQVLHTSGIPNPTEPDWSPDNKWIAFTSQAGEFDICVMPADGSMAPKALVPGEDPSWSPNSRTLVFTRRSAGGYALSVLDVMTKQVKNIRRISGNDSQPAWAH